MTIEDKFKPEVVAQIRDELSRFGDKCHYDETLGKIVYHSDHEALETYMFLQREEMMRHKWLESEKCQQDVGTTALSDWVCRYSKQFAQYWRKTHAFIPSHDGEHLAEPGSENCRP